MDIQGTRKALRAILDESISSLSVSKEDSFDKISEMALRAFNPRKSFREFEDGNPIGIVIDANEIAWVEIDPSRMVAYDYQGHEVQRFTGNNARSLYRDCSQEIYELKQRLGLNISSERA